MATETDANGNGTTHSNEIAANHQESCLWPNALQVIVSVSHLLSPLYLLLFVGKSFCFVFALVLLWKFVEESKYPRKSYYMLHFILMRDLMRIFFPFFVPHFLILCSVAQRIALHLYTQKIVGELKRSGHLESNLCGSMWFGRFFSTYFLFRIQTGSLSLLILLLLLLFIFFLFSQAISIEWRCLWPPAHPKSQFE